MSDIGMVTTTQVIKSMAMGQPAHNSKLRQTQRAASGQLAAGATAGTGSGLQHGAQGREGETDGQTDGGVGTVVEYVCCFGCSGL